MTQTQATIPTVEQTGNLLEQLLQKSIEREVERRAPLPMVNGALAPNSLEGIARVADMYMSAGMVPRSLEGRDARETKSKLMVCLTAGYALGLTDGQAVANIMVVNARPCLWGDAPLALVRRSEKCLGVTESIDPEGDLGDGSAAVCRVTRSHGDGAEEIIVRSFTVRDAKRAGLWEKAGPWKQYPRRMLQLRARAFALRDAFPDLLMGIGIAEEVSDDFAAARAGEQASAASDLASKLGSAQTTATAAPVPEGGIALPRPAKPKFEGITDALAAGAPTTPQDRPAADPAGNAPEAPEPATAKPAKPRKAKGSTGDAAAEPPADWKEGDAPLLHS